MQATRKENLSDYLKRRSKEICKDNHCTEDSHNCESYAYIRNDMLLLDICAPDYFQGCSQPYAAIPLPWTGTIGQLNQDVDAQLNLED